AFLALVMVVPVLLAYLLGVGFSLDFAVVRDTWRLLVASLAFGAIVVASGGTLMLAVSSLSRNTRNIGAVWVGFWLISNLVANSLIVTVQRDWCPLVSYTGNLYRLRDVLLDTETANARLNALFQAGRQEVSEAVRPRGLFGGRRGRRGFGPPPPPRPE